MNLQTKYYYLKLGQYLSDKGLSLEKLTKKNFPYVGLYSYSNSFGIFKSGKYKGKIERQVSGNKLVQINLSSERAENLTPVRGAGLTDLIYTFDREFAQVNNLTVVGDHINPITHSKWEEFFT